MRANSRATWACVLPLWITISTAWRRKDVKFPRFDGHGKPDWYIRRSAARSRLCEAPEFNGFSIFTEGRKKRSTRF